MFCALGLGGIYSEEKKQLAGRVPCWFEQLLAALPANRWGEERGAQTRRNGSWWDKKKNELDRSR